MNEDEEAKKRKEFSARLHSLHPQNSSYVSRLLFSILGSEARNSWRSGNVGQAELVLTSLQEISKIDLEGTIDQSVTALENLSATSKTTLEPILRTFQKTLEDEDEQEEMAARVLQDVLAVLSTTPNPNSAILSVSHFSSLPLSFFFHSFFFFILNFSFVSSYW